MKENKKGWVTPELIVLVRSNPEEAVLAGCKSIGGKVGNLFWDTGCMSPPCDSACFEIASS